MATPSEPIVTKIIFPVLDMGVAIAFYQSLGFDVDSFDAGYAWVKHRRSEVLHLAGSSDMVVGENRSAGYFHVQKPDDWWVAWSEIVDVVSEIADMPWGMREFSIRDPSGNLLRVGGNL